VIGARLEQDLQELGDLGEAHAVAGPQKITFSCPPPVPEVSERAARVRAR
jgi:hypothetical protein